jgi:hypothetical protein
MSKYDDLPPDVNPLEYYRPSVAPSPRDDRDYQRTLAGIPPPTAPAEFELPEWGARNQMEWGACTCFAVVGMMEIELRRLGYELDGNEAALYAPARQMHGWLCQNQGTYPRDVMRLVCDVGMVLEADWPYQSQTLCDMPSDELVGKAWRIRGAAYVNAGTPAAVKAAISEGHGVLSAMILPNNFSPDINGDIPLPAGGAWGGHAMLRTGYSDHRRIWRKRNSWSAGWGQRGYCNVPYAYDDPRIVGQHQIWPDDSWYLTGVIITDEKPEPEPTPVVVTYWKHYDMVGGRWQQQPNLPAPPYTVDSAYAIVEAVEGGGEVALTNWAYTNPQRRGK